MRINQPNIPDWIKKTPKVPIFFSILSVFSSEFLYEFLKNPNEYYKKWKLTDVPPIDQWLNYYTTEDIEIIWLENWIFEQLEDPPTLNLIVAFLKIIKRQINLLKKNQNILAPHITKKDMVKFIKWLENFDFDEFEKHIESLPESNKDNEYSHSPELLFLIRVWFPCFFYFGELPQNLFKKALAGDFQSLVNLLRIDKAILRNEKISAIFQTISLDTDSEEFKSLLNAIGSPIKINSKKKIKERNAAIISLESGSLNLNLTAKQIQDLFDCVASLRSKDDLIDTDIESTEALAKHIQRKSHLYKKLFELDKK